MGQKIHYLSKLYSRIFLILRICWFVSACVKHNRPFFAGIYLHPMYLLLHNSACYQKNSTNVKIRGSAIIFIECFTI